MNPITMRTQIQSLSHSLRQLSASLRSLFPKLQSSDGRHRTTTLEEMIEANETPQQQQQPETAHWNGRVGKMLGLRKRDGADRESVLSGRTLLEGDAEASLAGLHIWSA